MFTRPLTAFRQDRPWTICRTLAVTGVALCLAVAGATASHACCSTTV